MAKEKRMFSSSITKHDDFLDMPISAQALYFHLNMEADDEGFVSNVKSLIRQVRASDDDLKVLLAKRYVLKFESGVVVIKHWLIHNTIRQDRLVETKFVEEKKQLDVKENGSYTEKKIELSLFEAEKGGVSQVTDIVTVNCPPNLSNLFLYNTKLIIDYLNQKLNTRYRYDNTKTQAHIKARFNQGFIVDDFYKVIDTKYNEWFGTEQAIYLRPETLFGTKFESYLNQKVVEKGIEKSNKDAWEEVRNAVK